MEELSTEQIEALEQQLAALQQELEELLKLTEKSAAPVDLDSPIGRLTRIDAIQQQSMAQASRQGHQRRLDQVRAALSAIGRQEYGLCRSCEEPIGCARLKVRPETPFCLECQKRLEKK